MQGNNVNMMLQLAVQSSKIANLAQIGNFGSQIGILITSYVYRFTVSNLPSVTVRVIYCRCWFTVGKMACIICSMRLYFEDSKI